MNFLKYTHILMDKLLSHFPYLNMFKCCFPHSHEKLYLCHLNANNEIIVTTCEYLWRESTIFKNVFS